jgi:alpha/beta superfamily hydrolase
MNAGTRRLSIAGPAGPIECAIDEPAAGHALRGVAVLSHPHPQHGGTMDNKVVQTLARAFVQLGWRAVRFNFRGVGASGGHWDHGRGEVDDALAVIEQLRELALPLALGGFSFGAYVTTQAAARLPEGAKATRLVLIGPAVANFEAAAVPQNTLVVHGEADDVVPLAAVLDWARPQVLPVTVVPGAGHFFHGQLALLKQLIIGSWH